MLFWHVWKNSRRFDWSTDVPNRRPPGNGESVWDGERGDAFELLRFLLPIHRGKDIGTIRFTLPSAQATSARHILTPPPTSAGSSITPGTGPPSIGFCSWTGSSQSRCRCPQVAAEGRTSAPGRSHGGPPAATGSPVSFRVSVAAFEVGGLQELNHGLRRPAAKIRWGSKPPGSWPCSLGRLQAACRSSRLGPILLSVIWRLQPPDIAQGTAQLGGHLVQDAAQGRHGLGVGVTTIWR